MASDRFGIRSWRFDGADSGPIAAIRQPGVLRGCADGRFGGDRLGPEAEQEGEEEKCFAAVSVW